MGQLDVSSLKIDLISDENKHKLLTLASKPIIHSIDYISLITDLNRRYKDPVSHYTTVSDKILVNGNVLQPTRFCNKLTYVIFDIGMAGMVVSQELFEDQFPSFVSIHLFAQYVTIQINIEVIFTSNQNQFIVCIEE